MFWNRKKHVQNQYEVEYLQNERELNAMGFQIRTLVNAISIKNQACKMYIPESQEYKTTSDEALELKKKLLKLMGEYTAKRKLVMSMLETHKEHFVLLDKNRVTPLTAKQLVEVAIRYKKGK